MRRRHHKATAPCDAPGDETMPTAPLTLHVGEQDRNRDLVRQALPRLLTHASARGDLSVSELLFYLGASLVAVLLRCRASEQVEQATSDRALSRAIRRNVERDDCTRFGPVILVCAYHACTTGDWPSLPGLAVTQERLEQVFWQALSPANAERFRQLPALDDWHFETDVEGTGRERRLACTAWAKMDLTSPPGPLS